MFGDMMGKLQAMQQEVAASKKKLDGIMVSAEAGGNLVNITMTANKKVKEVKLSESLACEELEMIEDLLVTAFNRAIDQAEKIAEKEMATSAKNIMPNIPGL